MLSEISLEPVTNPAILITLRIHISQSVLLRHPQKVHLVQCRNQVRPVAAESAMKIDGVVTFILQECQYCVDMLLGRRDRRGIDGRRYEPNAVSSGLLLLKLVQKRKELQIHNVLDVPRLQKPIVGIGLRFRSFVDTLVHFSKANNCGGCPERVTRPYKQE